MGLDAPRRNRQTLPRDGKRLDVAAVRPGGLHRILQRNRRGLAFVVPAVGERPCLPRKETGRYRSGESDELSTLRALGIRTGGVYGSMLIMR